MRRIRETLRLHLQAELSYNEVGRTLKISKSVVGKYGDHAEQDEPRTRLDVVPFEEERGERQQLADRKVDAWAGLAVTTLYRQIKRFFADCAGVQRGQGDAKGAGRFEQASTHWMRHSHASHAIAAGMPIEIAQQNLGHASLATTTIYVTTEAKRRMRAVQRFWEK